MDPTGIPLSLPHIKYVFKGISPPMFVYFFSKQLFPIRKRDGPNLDKSSVQC